MRKGGTFSKRGLSLRSPPKNNARPTKSASLQKKSSLQSTLKIWPRLKADVSIIPNTLPVQSETSLGRLPLAARGYCIGSSDMIGHPRCRLSSRGCSTEMWSCQRGKVAPSSGRMRSLQVCYCSCRQNFSLHDRILLQSTREITFKRRREVKPFNFILKCILNLTIKIKILTLLCCFSFT